MPARAGVTVAPSTLGQLVGCFVPLSGPDGWRDLAELAAVTGSMEVWREAEEQAATIVAEATTRPDLDKTKVAGAVRRQLDHLKP